MMKKEIRTAGLPVLFALMFAGCCAHRVADPSQSITFVQAMHDVGQGLAEMKAAELETLRTHSVLREQYGRTDFVTGLFPSEVDVTFEVTANAAHADQLSVDLGAVPFRTPVNGSGGGNFSTSSSATRANQITIKFVSVIFAGTTTTTSVSGQKVVVKNGITDPKTLGDFLDLWNQHAFVPYLQPEGKTK